MNIDQKPFRMCWTASGARSVFVTEALEGEDAVFLATHSPISGFDVAGRDAGEFAAHDEAAVLETLSDQKRRHAFCVVQGEPGSGKSHLIRWLSVQWPHENDVKLLLRRADGSLEGALRQLRERLPAEFEDLFEGIGARQRASTQGRANNFMSMLANTLDADHYDERVGGEEWCARFKPAELLRHQTVRTRWQGPARILKLLEGGGGERNSATASFDLWDVGELGALAAPLAGILIGGARDLARRLGSEADAMEPYREANWLSEDLLAERSSEFPLSSKFVEVLNQRRNDAIRNVLGVSSEGLKTLFRKVRQALDTQDRRLVLLLEDITSWEGLDDSLIDVLVDNAETQTEEGGKKICPLVSVVGVTPAYYAQLKPNYRQRITHEIALGTSTGGLQDVASLRDPAERLSFVSRYLAAVRAGVPALAAWRSAARLTPGVPPPNACDACPKRSSCFAIFGADGDIGLFPFNGLALERFFDALKVDDNGQTWRTPRGILQAVLNPVLAQADLIVEGHFPGPLIESNALEGRSRSENAVSGLLGQIIATQVTDPDEEERFRRLVTFWGNPEETRTLSDGPDLAFAGVSRALYAAYDLPWLGADSAGAVVREAAMPVAPVAEPPAPTPPADGLAEAIRRAPPRQTSVPTAPRHRRDRMPRQEMREELRNWVAGRGLANASRWNDILYKLIGKLDPRMFGVAPFLLDKVVTPEMVKLEGSTTAPRAYMVVPPEEWVRAGFEAVLDLQLRRDMTAAERVFHHRNIAAMLRRLERLTEAYLRRRLPVAPDGSIWSPVPALAQVLLARAWLRGSVSPQAPLLEQLHGVLSDEEEASTDPLARSAPWREWLDQTNPWQERMREDLRALVALDTSGAGAAMVDTSQLTGAIRRMMETGAADPMPSDDCSMPSTVPSMARARDLAAAWNSKRSQIATIEYQQVKGRAAGLAEKLRGRTVDGHIERLHQAISRTSSLLPHAEIDQVQNWQRERVRVQARVQSGGTQVETLILSFDDEETIPHRLPLRIAWLAETPARMLEDVSGLVQLGEKVITALTAHARDCVRDGQRGESLADVRKAGRALKRAAGEEAEFEAA